MTFRVHFYADQAFFSMIKRTLAYSVTYDRAFKQKHEAEEAATCLIICHSACEAFLNILAHQLDLTAFDSYERKSIIEKIDILHSQKQINPDWSKNPFQDIRRVDKVRNWLTHFKKSDIGLINSMGQWIEDGYNVRPKIDDHVELKFERVKRYYDSCRNGLYSITQLYGVSQDFDYLISEEYESYLIG